MAEPDDLDEIKLRVAQRLRHRYPLVDPGEIDRMVDHEATALAYGPSRIDAEFPSGPRHPDESLDGSRANWIRKVDPK
jgi:hypothetical protein